MVSSKSRLKKASSDGVSILDTKEISGFTFCEAGEVVPEFLEPPSFDFWSMFSLQCFKCWQRQCQSGGVRSTGQANCRNHESTLANYVTTKIRKSASLPYEVINQDITPTWLGIAFKQGWAYEASPPAGTGMVHDVPLENGRFDVEAERRAQQFGECGWDAIEALVLESMYRHQGSALNWQEL